MLGIIVLMLTITLIGVVVSATVLYKRKNACKTPDTTLVEYMMHIPKQEYEEMYAMIDLESSGYISKEDFLKRNSTIYEGIEMQNMSIKNVEYVEEDKKVTYLTSFDTVAGTISFENEAFFINGEEGYKLVWDDSMIFPNLTSADKVRVSTTQQSEEKFWIGTDVSLQEKVQHLQLELFRASWKTERKQSHRLQDYWKSQRK